MNRLAVRRASFRPELAEIPTGTLPDCDAARLPEFSAQKAAREAHRNEQALARTRLRLSRRPILDAAGRPHYWAAPVDDHQAALLADELLARLVFDHNAWRAWRRRGVAVRL